MFGLTDLATVPLSGPSNDAIGSQMPSMTSTSSATSSAQTRINFGTGSMGAGGLSTSTLMIIGIFGITALIILRK